MEENKRIEFEMSSLVLETYNKIAIWVNSDYHTDKQKSDALKIVSQDIVQSALEKLLDGISVKTNTEVTRGGVNVGDYQSVRDNESFDKANEKQIFDKLFIDKS